MKCLGYVGEVFRLYKEAFGGYKTVGVVSLLSYRSRLRTPLRAALGVLL